MRIVSFKTLMDAFAGQMRLGRATLQPGEEEQMGADLNAAALWLWETETSSQCLPEMLTGKTVTLATGGVIEAADIDNASFWSVWKSDPRAALPGRRSQISAYAAGFGDVQVRDGVAGTTVFVLYKTVPPQWTTTEASTNCEYQTGDLVLSAGRVYRALSDEAHANDLEDATVWVEVTLPQSLQRIIVMKANYERMRLGAAMPTNAMREEIELLRALEMAFLATYNPENDKPWLANQNQ